MENDLKFYEYVTKKAGNNMHRRRMKHIKNEFMQYIDIRFKNDFGKIAIRMNRFNRINQKSFVTALASCKYYNNHE